MSRVEIIGDCTLYLGDCRDILPTLGPVDAVVTDAPYGVSERTARASAGRTGGGRMKSPARPRDWAAIHGDDAPFDPAPLLLFPRVVLFGANHFASRLPDASKWIVWDKREGGTPDDNADCELVWTNLGGPARIHRQLWRGAICRGEENAQAKLHPTQKPVEAMGFCVDACRLSSGATVLDPYMGSGSTGVAVVRRGLRFVGIEIDPGYFDIACRRIAQAHSQPRLFSEPAPKAVQPSLLDDAA